MSALLFRKDSLQVLSRHPLVSKHPGFSIPHNYEEENNVLFIPRSRIKKGDFVYHSMDAPGAVGFDGAGESVVQIFLI